MKQRWIALIVAFLILIPSLACTLSPAASPTPATPPHYGAFLQKADLAVEMKEYPGGPPSYDAEGIPPTSEPKPIMILWHPDTNLTLLSVVDEEGGSQIGYDAAPRDGGVLEIQPKEPLDRGVYCLVQGNPALAPSTILHWCFYCDARGVGTPTTTPTSAQGSPELPAAPPEGEPSRAGSGTVIGELSEPRWPEGLRTHLRLLALSEAFHPYEVCGMDFDEGFNYFLEANRVAGQVKAVAPDHYRFDNVPAGTSLFLLLNFGTYEDPSKEPTGFAIDSIEGCGPFALLPGQQVEIPWYSGCWGTGLEWHCPENLAEHPMTGPGRITGTYPESLPGGHQLALYALTADFSPYELCQYQDPLEAMSRRNQLIDQLSLIPGQQFTVESVPPGRSLALLDVDPFSGLVQIQLGSSFAILPGQAFDSGTVGSVPTLWLDCGREDTLYYLEHHLLAGVPPW